MIDRNGLASIGILMLETRFPRIPGDLGNPATWPFPVAFKVVRGASPQLAVTGGAEGLLAPFVEAGHALVAEGAQGIVTSCGFLVLFQDALRAALGVPVATSSLMQVSMVEALLPASRRAGILTISAASLTPAHLAAAGCRSDTPVAGLDAGTEFSGAILGNRTTLDVERARAENVAAAQALLDDHPEVGAIVLECTNMVPYAADIREACGVPVYSVESLVSWFHSGLSPRRYPST
ncbi:aspartate/glutamate racemase family protein [Stappia sp. ICDLI1TA098]